MISVFKVFEIKIGSARSHPCMPVSARLPEPPRASACPHGHRGPGVGNLARRVRTAGWLEGGLAMGYEKKAAFADHNI